MSTLSLTRPLTVVRSAVRLMLVAVALFALSAPARADVTFELKNSPQSDEENIDINDGTGFTVSGTTHTTGFTVNFSSTQELVGQGGQAKIAASDGSTLTNLKIEPETGVTFKDFILNPEDGSGTATVTVVLNDGTATFTYPTSGQGAFGNGNNFLTIVASNGESILSISIDVADGGFKDLKQPRISGATSGGGGTVVPEPSTMALALVGFTGLGLGGLRRLRRRPAVALA